MSAIWRCILISLLRSCTSNPAPAATRFFRLACIRSGLARSFLVIDWISAIWRLITRSSMPAASSCFDALAMPGIMPITPCIPPSLSICSSWLRRSFMSKRPFWNRFIIRSASAASICSCAFSTSETMSPIPRMRPATRSGKNSSSPSIFSPVPMNLIGRPVTARIDSAAPPRPSPSMRVSTTPVTPTRPWKFSATFTASCPVRLSTTSSVSCGFVASRTASTSAISASSTCRRPAVSSISTS